MSVDVLSVVKCGTEYKWEWKIENFSLNEAYYESSDFEFEGESWWLRLYRHGTIGYTDLCLSRDSSGSSIEVELSVSLKTTEGRKSFERRERKCFEGDDCHVIKQWISKSEFRNRHREFLSSGCLTIILTMKKAESGESESESTTFQSSWSQFKDKILHDIKQMFLNQENCDVLLRVQGREFSAHQAILTARSPVFASTFRNSMKEKETGIVDIEDVDPSCFPEFLCFLYCGEIDKLSVENIRSLFTAADKYQIMDLRTMCLEFMKANLCVDTFCETFVLALLHTETELINSCTDYFVLNVEDIIETDKWKSFAAENPTETIELFTKYVKTSHQISVHNQAKRQKKC